MVGDDRVALDRSGASAVADELWKGLRSGAVTAAATLSEALARPSKADEVEFADSELEAVRNALAAVGLTGG